LDCERILMYKPDKLITLDLLTIHAFRLLVVDGMETPDNCLLALLDEAHGDIGLSKDKGRKLNRRAVKILAAIVEPFQTAEANVAKFGLSWFYVVRQLIDEGRLTIVDGSALDKFCEHMLSDDGTLVEFANIEKVDASAVKQAKRMIEVVRKELGI